MRKMINVIGPSVLPILSNTIIIVPFMLFVRLSDGSKFTSILPFLLFYTCRMTGIFFIRGIKTSINSYTLLRLSLVFGTIGCLLAIFGFLYFDLYIAAGIFLGFSGAWLPPSNTSVNFYLKSKNKKVKSNVVIMLFGFVLLGFFMFVPIPHALNITFLIYIIMYIFAFLSVEKFPSYRPKSHELEEMSFPNLFLFAVYFILLFYLRSSRLLLDSVEFSYFVLGLFLVIVLLMARAIFFRKRLNLRVPIILSSLTVINGAIGNYLFLFSSLYATGFYGADSVALRVYLPYVLGMLLGSKLKSKNKFHSLAGVSIGLLMVLFTNLFSVGILIISLFKSSLNSWLTTQYIDADYLPDDKRIWIKYSMQNIGSITHQFLLMIIAMFILKIDKLPMRIFFLITSKSSGTHDNMNILTTWNHVATSLILVFIVLYGIMCYRKEKHH